LGAENHRVVEQPPSLDGWGNGDDQTKISLAARDMARPTPALGAGSGAGDATHRLSRAHGREGGATAAAVGSGEQASGGRAIHVSDDQRQRAAGGRTACGSSMADCRAEIVFEARRTLRWSKSFSIDGLLWEEGEPWREHGAFVARLVGRVSRTHQRGFPAVADVESTD
jgi:hypothetical protein